MDQSGSWNFHEPLRVCTKNKHFIPFKTNFVPFLILIGWLVGWQIDRLIIVFVNNNTNTILQTSVRLSKYKEKLKAIHFINICEKLEKKPCSLTNIYCLLLCFFPMAFVPTYKFSLLDFIQYYMALVERIYSLLHIVAFADHAGRDPSLFSFWTINF